MNDEELTTVAGGAYDNLEKIKGIGEGYAKALHKIGIHRFAELARWASADELQQTLLAQAGKNIPLWKIKKDDWLGQARDLVALQTNPIAPDQSVKAEQTWHQHAGFLVFFDYITGENGEQAWQTRVWQTRAYHHESGVEVQFAGIEASSWANWILERAGLRAELLEVCGSAAKASELPADDLVTGDLVTGDLVTGDLVTGDLVTGDLVTGDLVTEVAVTSEAPVEVPSPTQETQIEITDVEALEIAPRLGVPEKQIQAQIHFQISGPKAEKLMAEAIPFRLEVHIVDNASGTSAKVASAQVALQPQMFTYTSKQQFPIPKVGHYRLYCSVRSLPNDNLVAYYEGPIIHVVP